MRHNRLLLLITLVFVAASSIPAIGLGVKYKSTGTYVDSSGGQHPWTINDGHTLVWDSNAYIPAGAVFVSTYLAPNAGEDAYQADVKSLQALKSAGITDIILKGSGPITSSSPAALQKLVSFLDANGFAYGVEMDDGPTASLEGYMIAPGLYRIDGPSDKTVITCSWPNIDSAMYVVYSRLDSTIKTNGGAVVTDGKATITLSSPLRDGDILMVYPHKVFPSKQIADMWSGYDEYRDRLLGYFKGVKFGSGLRFLIEPFTSKMDFTGEMASFLPDSAGFRVGLEAYLTRKYKHQGGLNSGWGLNENLDTIEHAARLIPLWAQGRGAPFLYDGTSAHMFSINPAISPQIWADILDYRDTSAQGYMNSIADALHKQVANVPVIFKSSTYSRIYANPFSTGFDGIGAQAYGTGEAPEDRIVGPLYALAEESGKSTWFIAAGTQASADGKGAYAGETGMNATLDSFREVGCKGIFLDNLLGNPDEIGWLKSFKSKIDKTWVDFKPQMISYPVEPATGAYVKRVAMNTWWLPSLRRGNTTYIGDTLFSYTILGEGKSYVWSGTGKQSVVMDSAKSGIPVIELPSSSSVITKKGGMFTLNIDDSPTVIRGIDFNKVFPRDTTQAEIDRLAKLIPIADQAGTDVKKARNQMSSAIEVLKNGQAYIAYGIAQDALTDLEKAMGPDLWIEGEKSSASSLGSITAAPGASNALALVLDTDADPPMTPYSASYTFEAPLTASYELWLAASPPSEASPVSYGIDNTGWTAVAAADGKMGPYAPGLAWYKVATANLTPGSHTLTLRVDGRRTQDKQYYFAIDAIVLSPRGFTPNGIVKPF